MTITYPPNGVSREEDLVVELTPKSEADIEKTVRDALDQALSGDRVHVEPSSPDLMKPLPRRLVGACLASLEVSPPWAGVCMNGKRQPGHQALDTLEHAPLPVIRAVSEAVAAGCDRAGGQLVEVWCASVGLVLGVRDRVKVAVRGVRTSSRRRLGPLTPG